jgi:hypothetical protein
MQMAETELESITPRALFNKLTGFRVLQREPWEIARIQSFVLLSPYFEKNRSPTANELMPFPWDGVSNSVEKPDPKKMAEDRKKIWAEIDARKKAKIVG